MRNTSRAFASIFSFILIGNVCLAENNDKISGAYVGIRGGYVHTQLPDEHLSDNGASSDLFAGYGALIDRIYVGGEAFLGHDAHSSRLNPLKSGVHYGVRGRAGYQFFEPAIAYLSLGLSMESYKFGSKTSKQTPVLVPGLGVQWAVTDNISARFDLEHHLEQGFKFPGLDNYELKVSKTKALIGISYRF
jgi:opacity protein-like surface antigen